MSNHLVIGADGQSLRLPIPFPEERAEQLEDLELRDISDRKLRKVLRDLDAQVEAIKE